MNLPLITSAFLNVTDSCNLACKYCFVNKQPHHMTLQTAKDAVDFLANNAQQQNIVPSINFFGGEPTLMWDSIIVPLVDYAKNKYNTFDFSITTNGLVLDQSKVDFLKQNKMGILLSIDGDKTTQNINRPLVNGTGSFDKIIQNVPYLLQQYPAVMFRSTVTPETAQYLFDNMMFAENTGFQNYFVIPNCFEEWSESDINILKEQMLKYVYHYVDKMRQNENPIFFVQMEKNFKTIVRRNFAISNNEFRSDAKCKSCGKCGLGSGSTAAIGTDGSIYACQELCTNDGKNSPFYIGSIYDGIDDSLREKLCNEFDASTCQKKECETCQLTRICTGGCVANNYLANGDIHVPSTINCIWENLLFDMAIKIMNTLGGENNERFKDRWNQYFR